MLPPFWDTHRALSFKSLPRQSCLKQVTLIACWICSPPFCMLLLCSVFSVALISFSHTRQHTPYWMHCFSLPGRRWALPGRDCCLYHPPLYTSTYNTPKIALRKECESSLVFITCDLTAEIYLERKVSRETVEIFPWEIKQKNSGTEKIKIKNQKQGRESGSRRRE